MYCILKQLERRNSKAQSEIRKNYNNASLNTYMASSRSCINHKSESKNVAQIFHQMSNVKELFLLNNLTLVLKIILKFDN